MWELEGSRLQEARRDAVLEGFRGSGSVVENQMISYHSIPPGKTLYSWRFWGPVFEGVYYQGLKVSVSTDRLGLDSHRLWLR